MLLRCLVDGLLLPAAVDPAEQRLWAVDGVEGFALEALEALYYEIVAATPTELAGLERAGYRLLRRGDDFRYLVEGCRQKMACHP